MVGGVSRMIGPMWAGVVFEHLGIRSPFWVGAGLMLVAFFFSAVVKDEGTDDPTGAVILGDA